MTGHPLAPTMQSWHLMCGMRPCHCEPGPRPAEDPELEVQRSGWGVRGCVCRVGKGWAVEGWEHGCPHPHPCAQMLSALTQSWEVRGLLSLTLLTQAWLQIGLVAPGSANTLCSTSSFLRVPHFLFRREGLIALLCNTINAGKLLINGAG